MRKIVESDKFQQLWGNKVVPTVKWGEEKFENARAGFREGRPFISMTGGRGDRVLIDDPHSVDAAESEASRPKVIKTFREAIPDRLNDLKKSSIIVIMQRLHEDDVAGTIIKLGLPYIHLNLPMEFEQERTDETTGKTTGGPCRVFIGGELFFEDWRTNEGELLFPERFPADAVAALKLVKGPYAWAGQYQQRPTAREGGLFKRAWFAGKVIEPSELPARIRARCRAWDRAGTKLVPGKSPDFTASVRMSRNGPDYYIEHVTQDRDTPANIRKKILSFAETDPRGTILRLPKEPAQAGIDQAERDVEAFAGHPLKIKPVDRVNKELRATPLSIQCEFGNVYLIRGSWNDDFLDELCSFPMGAFDDRVDAAADAFDELAGAKMSGFSVESAGARTMAQTGARDSRYNFGDNAEAGFGS